jgi:hypothetical protein
VVDSICERGGGGAAEGEMPFEEVLVGSWAGVVVGGGGVGEFGCFAYCGTIVRRKRSCGRVRRA